MAVFSRVRWRRILAGLWVFVVGDDWRLALGAVVVIGVEALLAASGMNGWWLAVAAVPTILAASVARSLSSARADAAPRSVGSAAAADAADRPA